MSILIKKKACNLSRIGYYISGHYFRNYFLLFFSSIVYFSHRSAQIKKDFVKDKRSTQKLKDQTPIQTLSAILGPPDGYLGFCNGLTHLV